MKLSTVLLLAIAMAAPTSMAWSWVGSSEPDTQADVEDGLFFYETDTNPNDAVKKVYFNAFPGQSDAAFGFQPNPNVGATQSRIAPVGTMSFTAFLGVWKDCNGDGYLGYAESALLDYPSQLLIDGDDICPEGSFFNRDGWVSEFWAIGPQEKEENLTESDFPRIFTDGSARVWGDFGRLGEQDEIHFDCAQFPMQEGSGDSTGGLLLYFDCQLSYNVAKTMNANDPTGECGDLSWCYEGDNGQGYYHPERDCDSALNVHLDTYGNDKCRDGVDDSGAFDDADDGSDSTGLLETDAYCDSDEVSSQTCEDDGRYDAVRVWDCANYEETWIGVDWGEENPQNVTAANRTVELANDEGDLLVSVAQPPGVAPGGALADGSLWDSWFGVQDTNCSRDFADGNGPGEFVLSASFAGTNPADGKRMSDFNMSAGTFGSGVSGNNPRDVDTEISATNDAINQTADDVNGEAGSEVVPTGQGNIPGLPGAVPRTAPTNFALANTRSGLWGSNVIYLPPTYLGPTVRNSDFTQPAGGMYFTFYADLDNTVTTYQLPSTGAQYAAEPCESVFDELGGTSIRNGWECDPANWWVDFDIGNGVGSNGCHQFEVDDPETEADESEICVGYDDDPSPGDTYYIRDVDCYDGTLVGSVDGANGVGAGLTLLDEQDGPCPTVDLS